MNYSETELTIRDGLLELKGFPHGFVGQELKWWNILSDLSSSEPSDMQLPVWARRRTNLRIAKPPKAFW